MTLFSRLTVLALLVTFAACNNGNSPGNDPRTGDTAKQATDTTPPRKYYSNERFKDVWVERYNDTVFIIRGKAQVFEAAFSYVIEDGHNELRAGYGMTDAGAPAWGKFRVPIYIRKIDPNSTLTLVLFESSAKDGSRQYELPVPLF
jgi:hypothetical protein